MSTTITKTLKVKLNSKPVIEFCNDFEIPYVYCRIRLHYKDKSKIIDGVPKGVMNMTYAQAMEYNETITDPLFKSHINIILKNCEGADKLMVIDVDEKTDNAIIKVIHPSGVEIILPFNDDFIIEIDDDLKTIEFNAPEGLIEMYLS